MPAGAKTRSSSPLEKTRVSGGKTLSTPKGIYDGWRAEGSGRACRSKEQQSFHLARKFAREFAESRGSRVCAFSRLRADAGGRKGLERVARQIKSRRSRPRVIAGPRRDLFS